LGGREKERVKTRGANLLEDWGEGGWGRRKGGEKENFFGFLNRKKERGLGGPRNLKRFDKRDRKKK